MTAIEARPVPGRTAIVLGLSVNGLGVLRSLGALGVRCAGVYSDGSTELARFSRYATRTVRVSDPSSDEKVWGALDDAAGGDRTRPLLMPTADVYARFISRNREALAERFEVRCPGAELYEKFLDKAETIELCERHAIPIPPSRHLRSEADVERTCRDLRFPVIVKPRITFGGRFPGKNFVARTSDDLGAFVAQYPRLLGDLVAQEIVPSGDGNILVSAAFSGSNGLVTEIYVGRKIRQFLPDYGVTCFGVSESNPAVADLTRKFLDAIGFQGFAALEFAVERDTGKLYFLELNPRTYYHNRLFADAGVDLTQIAFFEMCGLDYRQHVPVHQRDGLVWLDFASDLRSFRRKKLAGQITFRDWIRSLAAAKSFAYYDRRDLKPFVAACARLVVDLGRHALGRGDEAPLLLHAPQTHPKT